MFTAEPMREVSLFVLEQDLEAVTEALARLEALHLEEVKPAAEWVPLPQWSDSAETYSSLSRRLDHLLAVLGVAREQAPPPAGLRPSQDWVAIEAQTKQVEEQVLGWQRRRSETGREIERLELACSHLQLLLPLEVPVGGLRELAHQHIVVGTIPRENLARVAEALFQIKFVLIPLDARKGQTVVLAASSQEQSPVLDRALKSAFFEPIEIPPEAEGPPREALSALENLLGERHARLSELENERRGLREQLRSRLLQLQSWAQANARLTEAIRHFPKHGEVYLIPGWVAARQLAGLHQAVLAAAGNRAVVEVLTPQMGRQGVPSLPASPAWLRPFERLVTTFGLSAYDEVNPTPLVAMTFLLMYGMMFGDAGHGFLLALLGAGWRMRKPSSSWGILVAAAGASSILFGLLYGVGFGHRILPAPWIPPLEDIPRLLLTAVAGGVLLLNVGFALNLVNAWRTRDWDRFYFGKNGLVGVALYWVLVGGGLGVVSDVWRLQQWLPMLLGIGLLAWVREPLAAKILGKPALPWGETLVTGFFELFESMISAVSNSLSFLRLGAFAVAHEGFSQVVLSYSGGRAGWLVFVVGTILIVGLEGAIVAIQALRLHYYEFFGRFFKGTGQPFVPISLKEGT